MLTKPEVISAHVLEQIETKIYWRKHGKAAIKTRQYGFANVFVSFN
jgi:hypothetical protein